MFEFFFPLRNLVVSSTPNESMPKFGLKLKSLKEGFESTLAMSFHCLLPHKKPEDKGQFVAVGWLLPNLKFYADIKEYSSTCA